MTNRVLIVGLDPRLIDFSDPTFAASPGLDAQTILAALEADKTRLQSLGYDASFCLTDFGETAGAVLKKRLQDKSYACVVIGNGVRSIPKHFLLFERLVNIAHEYAPQAKICFNTQPSDTAEAVQRWI